MRIGQNFVFMALLLGILSSGCLKDQKFLSPTPHDEQLVFPLPYDLTYLRTMEGMEALPNWELEETDKEKGLIIVRNTQYSMFHDAYERIAVIQLKRVRRGETIVQLTPDSQRVKGGDALLQGIANYVGREI